MERSSRALQSHFECVEPVADRLERPGLELKMTEANPIKRVDDLPGNIRDRFVCGPAGGENFPARRANSP